MLKFTSHMKEIEARFKRRGRALLLFDFDGTLSPIVGHPTKAILPGSWRTRLKELTGCRAVTVGIVTGRVASDIRRKVGIGGVILAANHGYEIYRGGRCVLRKGGEFRRAMKSLGRAVNKTLSSVNGVIVEQKDYSVAVHYRLVARSKKDAVKTGFLKLAKPYCDRHDWEIMRGKEILEVRPRDYWDKGKAVKWIWRRFAPKALPFYIGDDTTDEDAFEALGKRGVTVRVGRKRGSRAEYYVENIDEIVPFIEGLIQGGV